LWIDVEGAEFGVLEGMAGIKDRVVAVHVETAKVPLRQGQKSLSELILLMQSYGLVLAGSNIGTDSDWGDVVFISDAAIRRLGLRFALCRLKALFGVWVRADGAAAFLKTRWPRWYHALRRAYLKVGI
jgi:hypothetical protein